MAKIDGSHTDYLEETIPDNLSEDIRDGIYRSLKIGYHRIYFGEIRAVYADKNAKRFLA